MKPLAWWGFPFTTDLAIDLGTANTVVAVRGQGIVLDEPSVVAIRKGARPTQVVAVGREAKEMLGRTPSTIQAIRPMREGVISDVDVTEEMIRHFIRKATGRVPLRSRILISVPAGITQVETKAVRDAALKAGVKEVHLIEQPMAAAIGAGLPVNEPRGSMIVDIGGGTTDVAVISLGAMAAYKTLRVAGDALDLAIQQAIREQHNIMIGLSTAEKIKMKIGSAHPLSQELEIDVRGRHNIAGVPRSITVTSAEIRDAIGGCVEDIDGAVKSVLEDTPPELAADLIEHGILLAGGGSNLLGLDDHLHEVTHGLPVRRAENPLHAVVQGVLVAVEHLDVYAELLQ
ncbi:MAG: rod shape-determining protein [Myxococcota bacterium]|nr:rod shape-determining protein [Myxococcales bacterium]MBF94887.1 rod shape-determining protein [Myxococcales bacterium]MEC7751307.1 rod shape-determining protein [Myxococcota bacterium]HBU47154.1 rod shape-determining protein [Myxococcales bacterium]|tara:strand:- start:104 stop:1135 length:1032 start_codon:yes stop_codon:yes gene_type:complete